MTNKAAMDILEHTSQFLIIFSGKILEVKLLSQGISTFNDFNWTILPNFPIRRGSQNTFLCALTLRSTKLCPLDNVMFSFAFL